MMSCRQGNTMKQKPRSEANKQRHIGSLIGVVLLIANVIWKRKLMKEEQTLIAQGKEASA